MITSHVISTVCITTVLAIFITGDVISITVGWLTLITEELMTRGWAGFGKFNDKHDTFWRTSWGDQLNIS